LVKKRLLILLAGLIREKMPFLRDAVI